MVVDQQVEVNLVPQVNQAIKILETLETRQVSTTKAGHYLFDVGENIAGWCQIKLEGKPGDVIVMRHGEILEVHFEAYKRYIDNIHKSNPGLIWKSGLGNNYGDWLNGNTLRAEGFPRTGAQIPSEVFSTIMFYNSVNILSKMAKIIEKEWRSP